MRDTAFQSVAQLVAICSYSPATVISTGSNAEGLPIGVQIIKGKKSCEPVAPRLPHGAT